MKNKSFLNKLEKLKAEVPVQLDTERKLLPRLKFMGYVMVVLCITTAVYAMTIREETEIIQPLPQEGLIEPKQMEAVSGFELFPEEGELELTPNEVLNFYLVAFIFAIVGATCFLIVWKKKKRLFLHLHRDHRDTEL
jgi:hypothetical protein